MGALQTDKKVAEPVWESVWIQEVIHATCDNCGRPLRRKPQTPGISGGITWYHPHTSHLAHNGYCCT